MRRKKTAIGLSLLLSLILATGGGCASKLQNPAAPSAPNAEAPSSSTSAADNTAKVGPFKGMAAPDFVLKDLDGTAWTLSKLKGTSVALVFFASW